MHTLCGTKLGNRDNCFDLCELNLKQKYRQNTRGEDQPIKLANIENKLYNCSVM